MHSQPTQAMHPHGLWGVVVSWLMERLNAPVNAAVVDRLALRGNEAVLEIGFGTGALAKAILRRLPAGTVAGVDPSPLMVAKAQKANRDAMREGCADLREGRADRLPFADANFDWVVTVHSFQFWDTPESALSEILRVLRPGGRLLLALRDPARPPQVVTNPLSGGADEAQNAVALLQKMGFVDVRQDGVAHRSPVVVATRP